MSSKKEIHKIAFEGAGCVGKTTLLEALKTKFQDNPDVAFIDEAAREYFATHPVDSSQVFSVPVQTELQRIIWQKEQAVVDVELRPRVIFCDRSVIDSPVHVLARGHAAAAEILLANVQEWLPTYQLFLLLNPADVPYETDEIRRESLETRQMIHQSFLDFFAAHQLPFALLSGTLAERIKHVEKLLK